MDKPFLDKLRKIDPYVPGEQPKTDNIIKLNANENPYPPAPGVTEALRTFDTAKLAIYPDANAKALKTAIAERFDLQPSQVFLGNGSDDVLALAFQSFFCSDKPILYPDITYSFYPVWCDLFRIPYENMPLDEDFCVNVRDYDKPNGGIVLPNPGMRIGYALGSETLISTLEAVKNSYNSYTMDAIALAVGEASIRDEDYFQQTCRKVSTTRDRSAEALRALGFTVLPSLTNFLFVTHPNKKAPDIFAALREKGIFIRYFKLPRIDNYLRITVGTDEQMDKLIAALKEIL